jgi:hypothetical protein
MEANLNAFETVSRNLISQYTTKTKEKTKTSMSLMKYYGNITYNAVIY